MKRINSIDITRGIVMIIMALDHVRDLMHIDSITQNPTNLATTTPILFLTRFITHLCAPIFVFLAGTSVYLSLNNNRNITEIRKHLLIRGFWLIFLEFTVVNFAIFFDKGFHTLLFEVIATTGFGFIILSLMLKLSTKQIGLIGLIIIFCHGLVPFVLLEENSLLKTIVTPFFSPAALPLFAGKTLIIGYPPIPWLGIMIVGFASGQLFELANEKKSLFLKIGLASISLFIIVRLFNIYGDPAPWSMQKNEAFTFMSFLNISKYPPSLIFCLATLGVMFLIFAYSDRLPDKFKAITLVYGKVPFFYFILHFYMVHILTLVLLFLQGFGWSQLEFAKGTFGRPSGVESGISLWLVYLMWIFVVVVLYKPCCWFGRYKEKHKKWWLRYI